MAENVKVIVRCRPINKKEENLKCDCVVKIKNCMIEIWDPNEGPHIPKQFTFDSTYDQDSNSENIYNDICYSLVESVLEGYNATIFVYGQTGCGKSYTMEGNKSKDSPEKGIISRAFEHIFEAIAVTTGVKYLALISYLEIYNEQIRDLLYTSDKISANVNLALKETPNEGLSIAGLTTHSVHDASECEHFLNMGSKNRIIGATLMNQNSSRSHSIFTISIEQVSNVNNNESIKKGKLNLVDLAGSERQTKTGATGDRLKEATKINLSLSALGNVISALVDGKAKHIPYRDSKLTRLLQDSLGGNTRTLMIACISPSSRDYVETLSTLRYANRAKNIYNKPHINEDPKDTILRQYQEEITRLKELLVNHGSAPIEIHEINKNVEPVDSELNIKRDKLLEKYEKEMQKFKNLHESEKTEKENIIKQIEIIKSEYDQNIQRLNEEIDLKKIKQVSNEDILKRIDVLKAAIIGGEKAFDKELSDRRKRKKKAAEDRASAIAHLLAKIETDEDRDMLQNQYKDISQELNHKTEALRRFRYKVKTLEKEITDIQSEFEIERQDYLETIRKQERNIKLLSQISEKIATTLKKDCNYSDLESIKEKSIWLEDSQKFKIPELLVPRTKLPPAARFTDIQTAPARLLSNPELNEDKNEEEDIISTYFEPTMKRANELLRQSSANVDAKAVFNTWRGHNMASNGVLDFSKRNKFRSSEHLNNLGTPSPPRSTKNNTSSTENLKGNYQWLNNGLDGSEINLRKPFRLEALPSITKIKKSEKLNSLEYL